MDDLAYLPARELARRIRHRELTAADALEAALARIDRHNPALNAVVSMQVGAARRAAAEADATLRRGAPLGPLHGVPVTLKDCHDVAGMRTTVGSEVFDRVPGRDGAVAARLKTAGAVIVGHTNVPPFLADYVSDNPIFGRTHNPWNLDRTPGGSSGGAAAALAAGMTPLEVGSDLAGSLRLPPHFCGVYGLKATERRIPTTGFFRPPDGVPPSVRILGSLGPMARDLDDLELVLRLLSGPDGMDTDVPPVPLPARLACDPATLRLAVAPALPQATVAPALREQVTRVAAAASDTGAQVREALPELDWAEQRLFGELLAITEVFVPGAEPKTLAWYFEALARRDRFITAWHRFFEGYDALVLPPAATVAFGHEVTDTSHQGYMMIFANLAGLPVLTVPAGRDGDGLPVGVQLVGPQWSEVRLLEIAAALEAASVLPGFTAPPGFREGG
ncbi:MAG: amidase [Micromonosporaceae bacterium]